jgi:hypothetical protein
MLDIKRTTEAEIEAFWSRNVSSRKGKEYMSHKDSGDIAVLSTH